MIKVKTHKLSGEKLLNDLANDFAIQIQKDFKNHICDIHPEKTSYLIVVIKKPGIKLKKGSFCCPEFKKTIKIK